MLIYFHGQNNEYRFREILILNAAFLDRVRGIVSVNLICAVGEQRVNIRATDFQSRSFVGE